MYWKCDSSINLSFILGNAGIDRTTCFPILLEIFNQILWIILFYKCHSQTSSLCHHNSSRLCSNRRILNRKDLSMNPCSTAFVTSIQVEQEPLITTLWPQAALHPSSYPPRRTITSELWHRNAVGDAIESLAEFGVNDFHWSFCSQIQTFRHRSQIGQARQNLQILTNCLC